MQWPCRALGVPSRRQRAPRKALWVKNDGAMTSPSVFPHIFPRNVGKTGWRDNESERAVIMADDRLIYQIKYSRLSTRSTKGEGCVVALQFLRRSFHLSRHYVFIRDVKLNQYYRFDFLMRYSVRIRIRIRPIRSLGNVSLLDLRPSSVWRCFILAMISVGFVLFKNDKILTEQTTVLRQSQAEMFLIFIMRQLCSQCSD